MADYDLEFIIDGDTWDCWTLNSDYLNPSVYSNFAFNSFCNFAGYDFACDAEGVHIFDSDTDNGEKITPGIILAPTTFDMAQTKRFRKAYFGMTGSTPLLRTTTERGVERTFRVVKSELTLRRDQKGKKWTFLLEDFETLDFIELIPVVLGR